MKRPHINPSQKIASDPQNSCWVEASAGSGKTKVLTDRVLNLLLHGADPEKILCLTFTKAAAAEMANRLRDRLSNWATLDKDALISELENIIEENPEKYVKNAQKLFAKFVDTPGGLKIQTIHSFCHALLKKFPLESGIFPHFSVIDEEEQKKLHQKSFVFALNHSDKIVLESLTTYLSADDLEKLLSTLKTDHKKLESVLKKHKNISSYILYLKASLNIKPEETEKKIISNFYLSTQNFIEKLHTYAPFSEKDESLIYEIKSKNKNFPLYKNIFLTQKDTIRKKVITDKNESLQKLFFDESERVFRINEKIKNLKVCESTHGLLDFYFCYFDHYENLKQQQNVLDFDDLIEKTKVLLEQSDLQPWVLYKLDGGIDHILVDEAQDTNPEQWNIIAAITKEFFSGFGAKENHRTLFVVGDTKQSIYSFQGANPEIFDDIRSLFSALTQSVNHPWKEIDLNISYRSTPSVLKAVDQVFHQNSKLHKSKQTYKEHISHRNKDAGRVEVWPLTQPEETEDLIPWTPPKEQKLYKSTRRKLAEKIAQTIHGWVYNKEILESKGRPIDPSDIMILVRRRDEFVAEMVRALKRHKIDVTGIDRLVLTDQLPIMDLITFTEFLLLPDDSLKMAMILKSPLINFSEEDLFNLCHKRPYESLWQTLKERKDEKSIFQSAYKTISYFLDKIDFLTPYEFYMEVLSTKQFKQNFLQRLGAEAEDTLDEFLNICLTYEQNHIPSLQNFVYWIQSYPPEIKRNLEQSVLGKVRIMTVHGSKGLQAPIVFLPDTTNVPIDRHNMLWDHQNLKFIWCPKSNLMTENLAPYKLPSKEIIEYNRLLYVAMTRAEDRLYVCGWQPKVKLDPESWYTKISSSIASVTEKEGESLILKNPQINPVNIKKHNHKTKAVKLPDWYEKIPATENTSSIINPSKMEENAFNGHTKIQAGNFSATDKGNLIHKILQWILKSPIEDRPNIIENYLKKFELGIDEANDIKYTILKTLACEEIQPFIKNNYICEMPIMASSSKGTIKGIIDLVHFNFDRKIISVLDYKTGIFDKSYFNIPPQNYVQQLSIYKNVIKKVYSDFEIKNYLVWTDGPYVTKLKEQLD